MKISLGAAERDFLRYFAILMRILPLSVLTLHVPSPVSNEMSVLPVLNVPVTLPLELSLRKCRSRDSLPRKRFLQVVFCSISFTVRVTPGRGRFSVSPM